MDPNAALLRLLNGLFEHDPIDSCQAAEEILEWIGKGGHSPNLPVVLLGFLQQDSFQSALQQALDEEDS